MAHFLRRVGVGALLFSLFAAWGGRQPLAASAAGLPLVPATRVIVFHPSGARGAAVAGDCGMGESIAADRPDAWRCAVGNTIYDPCFSTSPRARTVICGATPARPYGIRAQLAAPLPEHRAGGGARPWIVLLGDGTTCGVLTGAAFGIGGERANYGCSDRTYLIGDPVRGRVWLAAKATLADKAGANGPTAGRIWAVSIATAWE